MRIFAAIVALCAAALLSVVCRHWWIGDPRQASQRTIGVAILILMASTMVVLARPSPYPPVTQFNGDRYAAQAQMGADVVRAVKAQRHKAKYLYSTKKRAPAARQRWRDVPAPAPRPLTSEAPLGLYAGVQREAIEALPARMLAGVVAPLASKAREIVAACGSKVISGVRHTYVAGTGGRLSLHASGRAVDIKGNPGCIYSMLHGWPGGYSTDYARPSIQHVHISYAPHGPEWGKRFAHYRGGHRHKHSHHRRRA